MSLVEVVEAVEFNWDDGVLLMLLLLRLLAVGFKFWVLFTKRLLIDWFVAPFNKDNLKLT